MLTIQTKALSGQDLFYLGSWLISYDHGSGNNVCYLKLCESIMFVIWEVKKSTAHGLPYSTC